MRYLIRLSYDGTGFSGWQIQPNADSIQERLQNALTTLLGEETPVTGAGRTDAGVSATDYTAHFDTSALKDADLDKFGYKINAITPRQINVISVQPVSEDFHARFSAREREYTYYIHRCPDPFIAAHSYLCRYPLDMEKMNEAASYIIGRHDFSCFEKTGGNNATSICDVRYAEWECYVPDHVRIGGYEMTNGGYMFFKIRADRYLRNMVRAVVGSLIDVGRGKRDPLWIRDLVENGTRSDAGESVPANALFLSKVDY